MNLGFKPILVALAFGELSAMALSIGNGLRKDGRWLCHSGPLFLSSD